VEVQRGRMDVDGRVEHKPASRDVGDYVSVAARSCAADLNTSAVHAIDCDFNDHFVLPSKLSRFLRPPGHNVIFQSDSKTVAIGSTLVVLPDFPRSSFEHLLINTCRVSK
jgi:hypothetical protein